MDVTSRAADTRMYLSVKSGLQQIASNLCPTRLNGYFSDAPPSDADKMGAPGGVTGNRQHTLNHSLVLWSEFYKYGPLVSWG